MRPKRSGPDSKTPKELSDHEMLADRFRSLVQKRTGLSGSALVCPRERSDMTPCLARDGRLVVVEGDHLTPICVGCEADLHQLLADEEAKHPKVFERRD